MRASAGSRYQLTESAAEKDLGMLINNQLSFKDHVACMVSRANPMNGITRGTFDYPEEGTFVALYKSLVSTVLHYGHSVWQSHHKMLCKDTEDIQ